MIPPIDEWFKQLIREIGEEHQTEIEGLEGLTNHAHLLVRVDPQFGIHRLVKLVKAIRLASCTRSFLS